MESQILTFCLGFGGWVGVMFSVGAFFVNDEPLGLSVLAKHSVVPFVSAAGFTGIVQGVRFLLLLINLITDAMLNRFIIMNFLQILTSLVTGVVMGAAYYNFILPSLKTMFYEEPAATMNEETAADSGSEEGGDDDGMEANDVTTETSDVTEDVSGGDVSVGDDTGHSSDNTEDNHADDESEDSVYVPYRKWWPF